LPAADSLRRFRLLTDGAVLSSFLLIVVGGVVRVSDAGLGCGPAQSGIHGWPLCQGGVLPSAQTHAVIEYAHRILAAAVVILLVAILWQALHGLRERRGLVLGAVAATALVAVQALLGALTVEHGLDTTLVAAHLGLAMLLLGVLVVLALAARGRPSPGREPAAPRVVAVPACALLLATIVAGGLVAGSERHGTPDGGRSEGAHMACGAEFPSCNGALLPLGESEMIDIQLAHRIAMLLAVAAIGALVALLLSRGSARLGYAIATVLATQVWLGALNVWAGETAALVVAHLAVATLLWALVVAALPSDRRSAGASAAATARELAA
jgi:heme A synthase